MELPTESCDRNSTAPQADMDLLRHSGPVKLRPVCFRLVGMKAAGLVSATAEGGRKVFNKDAVKERADPGGS